MAERAVLVIAAHPDDEVLGCGGTIAKHARAGAEVYILIVGEGLTSRGGSPASASDVAALQATARKAAAALGAREVEFLGLPDNRLDGMERLDLIQPIEAAIARCKPATVYTHHIGDVNIDHRRIHEAVVTACRPVPGHCVETLLFFEVSSSTEWQPPGSAPPFVPDWFEDISGTLEVKLGALAEYSGELRPWPHPRSPEAVTHLARWRGATCGTAAAEAFVLGRRVGRS
jgi:LmbE family N-acetylglucosaminyl deacetylase